MIFLAEKIDQLNIGWNKRSFDEVDFFRLCKRFGISVEEMPLTVGGFYYRVMGRDFIAVNSKLNGATKLVVMFHELGHFLFHTPESGATANFHGVGRQTRQECEADVFAMCCIIPKLALQTKSAADLIDDGVSPGIVAARHAILDRYGI